MADTGAGREWVNEEWDFIAESVRQIDAAGCVAGSSPLDMALNNFRRQMMDTAAAALAALVVDTSFDAAAEKPAE